MTVPTIAPKTFEFLLQLSFNNHKTWFDENKDLFKAAQENVLAWLGGLLPLLKAIDSTVQDDPKKALYRIYRDVRFAKDKTPYKTHFAALVRRGPAGEGSAFYIHLEPRSSIVGGGLWQPDPERLARIRRRLAEGTSGLMAALDDPVFQKTFGPLHGEKLARPPKGYEKDHPRIELIKHKDFLFEKAQSDEEIFSSEVGGRVADLFKKALPFLTALDE